MTPAKVLQRRALKNRIALMGGIAAKLLGYSRCTHTILLHKVKQLSSYHPLVVNTASCFSKIFSKKAFLNNCGSGHIIHRHHLAVKPILYAPYRHILENSLGGQGIFYNHRGELKSRHIDIFSYLW
jgi:hypothetical protein